MNGLGEVLEAVMQAGGERDMLSVGGKVKETGIKFYIIDKVRKIKWSKLADAWLFDNS